ncbi:MAG: hypothetical protein IJT97_00900 [Bacteroidaceae bacterium]|nr:hypothetical protein [Bacteroidaceae bacterium]
MRKESFPSRNRAAQGCHRHQIRIASHTAMPSGMAVWLVVVNRRISLPSGRRQEGGMESRT